MLQFQVLCRNEFHWVPSGHGSVPPNAVVAGNTGSGEPLYVGRTFYNGAQTVGKVRYHAKKKKNNSFCVIIFSIKTDFHSIVIWILGVQDFGLPWFSKVKLRRGLE